ncbi:cupredoxin domain-containing protein [Levilactobacillus brevis]|uniref:cupredoxin domain-containing protein n=1 Tax=Levilactobacillus brevis TaxID=1580 RepID=UPI003D164C87
MLKLTVLIVGLLIIGFILWWFFGPHHATTVTAATHRQTQNIDIEVNGGYSPENIVLKQGIPATLSFVRQDASSCLDHVVFADFGINQELPRHQKEVIHIDTSKPGNFQWACGMDMFHGNLTIK